MLCRMLAVALIYYLYYMGKYPKLTQVVYKFNYHIVLTPCTQANWIY